MKKLGLVGFPLGHSFSVPYFKNKFEVEGIQDYIYESFPIPSIDLFPALIQNSPDLIGLNVTIPYKEKVISFLDALDPVASRIGAVNTIQIRHKKLVGFNTDYLGFKESLVPLLPKMQVRALVLGTGGAAKAVKYVLEDLSIPYFSISRNPEPPDLDYSGLNATRIKDHLLIINTTPLGMYPEVDHFPQIPYNALSSEHILYDLIYNPAETAFLRKGMEAGATTKNGLEMLHLQAEASWRLWNN